MSFFLPQNPGIGGLDELTTSEEAAIQLIAGLGSPNQALRTNATGDGLEWFTLGGGTGDVTKVGTPVNNQVGVWTGDGTIEGDAGLTFDTTTDLLTTGILNATSLTASEIVITDASKNLVSAAVATYPSLTELSYVKGVTSAIQTQINSRVADTGDTMTGALSISVAGTPLTITNTNDVAANTVLTIQSDRATPATNDQAIIDIKLSDSAGNQTSFGKISVLAGDVTDTSEDGSMYFGLIEAGTFASKYVMHPTSFYPFNNGTQALGKVTTNEWANLFLAEGGVINWDNGDATLTQTGNVLALGGADFRIGNLTASEIVITDASKNLVSAAVATYPSLTELTYLKGVTSAIQTQLDSKLALAGGTLTGNLVLGENTSIDFDPAGSADGKYSGFCITGTAGAALSFGQLIYLAVADSRWELADADATATAGTPLLGMCVLAAAGDGSATKILLQGTIRADAQFPALTIGAPAYVGETAGAIQTAIPTGADNVIRIVGHALTADELYFNPSQDHQVTVA